MALTFRSRSLVLVPVAAALLLVSAVPTPAEAQRRHRRTVVVVGVGGHAYPYWRYDPWYQWGPYRYPPYGYRYGMYDVTSDLRLDVTPRQAQVYVDGYYAGVVDEFDGVFQRLRVEPGGHTITLYLEGYRTETQDLYLRPGSDQRIRLNMRPLEPGERADPPLPPQEPDRDQANPREPDAGYGAMPQGEPGRRVVPSAPREVPARFGTLALRVQPADAEVFVDGEAWTGAADDGRFSIQLSEGRHRVEVRRSGLTTYAEDVLIRRDRTLTLNVSLTR